MKGRVLVWNTKLLFSDTKLFLDYWNAPTQFQTQNFIFRYKTLDFWPTHPFQTNLKIDHFFILFDS